MRICFVVCPIGEDNSNTRNRSDQLLKHIIEPVCDKNNLKVIRVDTLNSSDSITNTIVEYLNTADLVIADLSDHNPNAFYEIGYRSALKKPIIHLKNKETSIPFDISSIRTFDYNLTNLDAVEELKQRLNKTIATFNFDSSINENNEKSDNDYINSQVLQELFKIHDGIEEIKKQVSNNKSDTAAVSVLADKLADTNKISIENTMATLVLKEIFNDPSKLHTITSAMKQLESIK